MIEQLSLTHRYSPTNINASRTAKLGYYLIKSVDEDLMSELRRLTAGVDEDRVSGARQTEVMTIRLMAQYSLFANQ